MPYTIELQRNEDGVVRDVFEDGEWNESNECCWTDGNLACDCNRHLAFERAGGNQNPTDVEKCSNNKYTALRVRLPDGTTRTVDEP